MEHVDITFAAKFFEGIGKFFIHHSPFIFGVIINVAIIYAICKGLDIFTSKLEDKLRSKNIDVVFIPKSMTSILQPLDCCINFPF